MKLVDKCEIPIYSPFIGSVHTVCWPGTDCIGDNVSNTDVESLLVLSS